MSTSMREENKDGWVQVSVAMWGVVEHLDWDRFEQACRIADEAEFAALIVHVVKEVSDDLVAGICTPDENRHRAVSTAEVMLSQAVWGCSDKSKNGQAAVKAISRVADELRMSPALLEYLASRT